MKAIRGATTISADTPAEIKDAVGELLIQMREQNGLTDENMICILFSNTSDIKSAYPAKAAREAGFYSCALFSSLEPEIERALPLCIRVMILAEIENPVPVYLRGAANLRKDLKKFAIALDGPSGSGKSTVAKMLARKLNILYLDTGAMYRACALKAIGENVERFTEDAVAPLIENIALDIQYTDGTQRTILDGEDVSEKIRRPEVSMAASAHFGAALRADKNGGDAERDRAKNVLRSRRTGYRNARSSRRSLQIFRDGVEPRPRETPLRRTQTKGIRRRIRQCVARDRRTGL